MRTADVVVIGAGIVGLSVAYHLAGRTGDRVLVIDKADYPGAGATARATGGIRHQFMTETNIRMTQISVHEYLQFHDWFGVDIEFEQTGYLFMTGSRATLQTRRQARDLQVHLGVPTEVLTKADLSARFGFLICDDLVGGTFCPIDGSANPYAALTGYVRGLRSSGGELVMGEDVVDVIVDRQRVRGLRTNREFYATPLVIDAAGAEAGTIAVLVGLEVPVRSFRRQVAVIADCPLDPATPFLVDLDSGWYLHRQRGGFVLLGGTDRDTRPGADETVDARITEAQVEAALRRIQCFGEARLVKAYTGIRSLTPDDHAILGPVPECQGFFLACGLGGHGFMHAPAVGWAVAEWVVTGSPGDLDPNSLSVHRFRTSERSTEAIVF